MKIINVKPIYEALKVRRKVSKIQVTESEFFNYINTINEINNLAPETTIFGGFELDKWLIPSFWSDIIEPDFISVGSERTERNYREYKRAPLLTWTYREEGDKGKEMKLEDSAAVILSRTEFNGITMAILNTLRANSDKTIGITRTRKSCIDADFLKRHVSSNGFVRDLGIVPIESNHPDDYIESWYSYDKEDSFLEWFISSLSKANESK